VSRAVSKSSYDTKLWPVDLVDVHISRQHFCLQTKCKQNLSTIYLLYNRLLSQGSMQVYILREHFLKSASILTMILVTRNVKMRGKGQAFKWVWKAEKIIYRKSKIRFARKQQLQWMKQESTSGSLDEGRRFTAELSELTWSFSLPFLFFSHP